jgi:polyhydroxyalkanoate synthesis regulator phasin
MKNWYDCTFEEKLERWTQALRVLKELLRHVRTKHWNMSHWGIQTECGTVACAAGHCGMDPWFRKRGLKLKAVKFDDLIKENVHEDDLERSDFKVPKTLSELENYGLNLGEGGFENNVDVSDFFGDEEYIFSNGENRSVNDVIKEIKKYIKELQNEFNRLKAERDSDIKEVTKESVAQLKEDIKDIEEQFQDRLKDIG